MTVNRQAREEVSMEDANKVFWEPGQTSWQRRFSHWAFWWESIAYLF